MKVFYINNDGGGFADTITFPSSNAFCSSSRSDYQIASRRIT
jgi:hypothetical protein